MTWPTVAIRDVARIVGGATPKTGVADYWNGAINWATPKDLSNLNGKFIANTPRKITDAGLSGCAAEVLPPSSVLFSSRAPIGHVAINTSPMATNQGFKSFIPGPRLDADFLFWWLDAHREQLQALGTGATFKEVSKATVERIEIPLPPLEEQKRIAAILDQADALRRLRRRALDRLNTLGQAIFHEMFGSPAAVTGSNDIRPLEDFVNPRRPITYGILKPGPDVSDGVPYVRVVDMVGTNLITSGMRRTSAEISHAYKRSRLEAGDLLMSIRGHVGRTSIVPEELAGANITQDTARLAVPQDQAEYFRYSILHPASQEWMRQRTRGAAVQGLNLGDLRQLPIRDAPISDRVHFSQKVASLTFSLSSQRRAFLANERVFTSLQHRAFRGEL